MKAIIMAAGKGTRLAADGKKIPKVMRVAAGNPLIDYVLEKLSFLKPEDIYIIAGYEKEKLISHVDGKGYNIVIQGSDGYGTGYAVICAMKNEGLSNYQGDIIILNGDSPLLSEKSLHGMIEVKKNTDGVILSAIDDSSLPYGRVIKDKGGKVVDIREVKECSEEELKIKEVNVGMYIFDAEKLREALSKINNNNNANEYYLTDVPPAMYRLGYDVLPYVTDDKNELLGVNTFEDLANVEKIIISNRTGEKI